MCVNDISRVGGRVLFFLDYLATGKLEEGMHAQILQGIVEGCKKGGFPLMGGETAELPGMYEPGHFDLAGFAVGEVRKDKLLHGNDIQPGYALLGIESSGIHSNGYSLARKIFFEKLGLDVSDRIEELDATVGEALLEPTLIYTKAVQDLLTAFPGQIQSMAHITGGGMPNKLPNALPDGLGAQVYTDSWNVHEIFDYMAKHGPVDVDEMRNTFNMGLGMVAVVRDEGAISEMQSRLSREHGLKSYQVGQIVEEAGVDYV
jgi:phosphoribosylformylglycinamidine cyclo-ligase